MNNNKITNLELCAWTGSGTLAGRGWSGAILGVCTSDVLGVSRAGGAWRRKPKESIVVDNKRNVESGIPGPGCILASKLGLGPPVVRQDVCRGVRGLGAQGLRGRVSAGPVTAV